MRKVKCANNHYYDADRFNVCPICGDLAGVPYRKPAKAEETMPSSKKNDDGNISAKSTLPPTTVLSHEPSDSGVVLEPEKSEEKTAASSSNSETLQQEIKKTGSDRRDPLPVTVAHYDFNDIVPPVGWLVGISGVYLGTAFECKAGRNRIGRNPDMEIALINDPTVSRDTQAILIYEPIKRQFFIQVGTSDGLVYLNDEMVFSHNELHAYDKLSFGKAKFVFVPLCGDQFTWDTYVDKE